METEVVWLSITTFVTRFLQASLEAAPTVVVGIMLAAMMRTLVPRDIVRGLFAGSGWNALVRASIIGTLVPVCSLGVLPIMRELRRAGVETPKLISFGLAAPMLNPITLVYGLTTLDVPLFLLIVGITVLVAVGVGAITSRWADHTAKTSNDTDVALALSSQRLVNAGLATARVASGIFVLEMLAVLSVSAIAAACIPTGFHDLPLHYTQPAAGPLMMVATFPAFIAPTTGIMQVSAMASVQFSLCAALALHVFGVGTNPAFAVWVWKEFGGKRLFSLAIVVIAVAMTFGYTADALLSHPQGSEVDTEALDPLTRVSYAAGWQHVLQLAVRTLPVSNFVAIGLLGALFVMGLVVRTLGWETITRVEVAPEQVPQQHGWLSSAVPRGWLIGIIVAAIAVTFVAGTHVYYPSPTELFADLSMVQANAVIAVRTEETDVAIRELRSWDYLAGKLATGAALRGESISEDAAMKVAELKRLLEQTRTALQQGRLNEAKDASWKLVEAQRACRDAIFGATVRTSQAVP